MDRQQNMEQKTKARKRRMKLVTFVMVSFLVWAGYTWYTQAQMLDEKKESLAELKQQSAALKKEQEELQFKVEKLQDKEYIGELARKYYFFSKPGEIIFVVPEKE